jgi:hypothetical protein
MPNTNIVNDEGDADLDKSRNFLANIRKEKFKSLKGHRD